MLSAVNVGIANFFTAVTYLDVIKVIHANILSMFPISRIPAILGFLGLGSIIAVVGHAYFAPALVVAVLGGAVVAAVSFIIGKSVYDLFQNRKNAETEKAFFNSVVSEIAKRCENVKKQNAKLEMGNDGLLDDLLNDMGMEVSVDEKKILMADPNIKKQLILYRADLMGVKYEDLINALQTECKLNHKKMAFWGAVDGLKTMSQLAGVTLLSGAVFGEMTSVAIHMPITVPLILTVCAVAATVITGIGLIVGAKSYLDQKNAAKTLFVKEKTTDVNNKLRMLENKYDKVNENTQSYLKKLISNTVQTIRGVEPEKLPELGPQPKAIPIQQADEAGFDLGMGAW